MTQPIILPPITVTQGREFYQEWTWTRDGDPVDMSGWSGEAVLKRRPQGNDLWRGPVDLDGNGVIALTVPAGADLPARAKVGPYAIGVFELRVVGPDDGAVFQGTLNVAGAV